MLIHLNQAQQAYLLDLVRENLQALVDADGDFIEQSLLGASVMTALQRSVPITAMPVAEVAIDMARTVGENRLHSNSGDSRDDWRDICGWAEEFEAKFIANPDAGDTYILDVEECALALAKSSGWTT